MGAFLTTILPALLPALTDGARGIIAKFTGGAGGLPVNIDERIKLMQAETDKLKALAEIDKPIGEPSQIIVDIRAIFRYAVIAGIWIITAICMFFNSVPTEAKLTLIDISGSCLSFVIGERFYIKIKS